MNMLKHLKNKVLLNKLTSIFDINRSGNQINNLI